MSISDDCNIKRDNSNTMTSGQQFSSYSQTISCDVSEQPMITSMVYCIHHKDGCKWSDELRNLKSHLNICRYDAVRCPSLCGAMISRLLLEDHLRFTCNLRKTICRFCSKIFTGEEFENHHCLFDPSYCENKSGSKVQNKIMDLHINSTCSKKLVKCESCKIEFISDTLSFHQSTYPRVPVACPNCCDISTIPREDLNFNINDHFSEVIVPCIFKETGCKYKGQKICLDAHLDENSNHHLTLLCGAVTKQQQQMFSLRNVLSKISLNDSGILIWKINDFATKLRDAKSKDGVEHISTPFYTSQYGYKLQASIFLNGNGVGEGSQVSIYIIILPGEYDSILKWPFLNTVSFTLFDQNPTADKTFNIVESFNPDPSWKNFRRPSQEPDSLGFGFPRFVSHDTLMKRNYIRDDTCFLKIKIEQGKIVSI